MVMHRGWSRPRAVKSERTTFYHEYHCTSMLFHVCMAIEDGSNPPLEPFSAHLVIDVCIHIHVKVRESQARHVVDFRHLPYLLPCKAVSPLSRALNFLRLPRFSTHKAGFDLGMRNGMILAVPNPSPMAGGAGVDAAIRVALEEANARGLKGRDVTPFVLAAVNDSTGGQSLKSNVALVSFASFVMVRRQQALSQCAFHNSLPAVNFGALEKRGKRRLRKRNPRVSLPPLVARSSCHFAREKGCSSTVRASRCMPMVPLYLGNSPCARRLQGHERSADVSPCNPLPWTLSHQVRHNAEIGAEIAVELAGLTGPPASRSSLAAPEEARHASRAALTPEETPSPLPFARSESRPSLSPKVVVFGGAVSDVVSKPYSGTPLTPGTSSPGETRQSFGGVGRNVAEGLARVLAGRGSAQAKDKDDNSNRSVTPPEIALISAVGADDAGRALVVACEEAGVSARATVQVGAGASREGHNGEEDLASARTASYVAMLDDDGELVAAVADMRVLERMTAVRTTHTFPADLWFLPEPTVRSRLCLLSAGQILCLVVGLIGLDLPVR